ncbi:sulfatase-like hydrolase/transferase [Halapricum desulfuricans]|uniref:Arylsulfatase A or related enzyme n=1 Tax=Halapricum desulfuricans TaxID=2841257 RepID=A0A897MYP3_9EURY|nr:sulfatase-like hydrolase/transferase [Halapricum desulfuricans]QSG05098.1 Arylsulfatase A or related enzyme [Halapricum desulfuricans]
MTNIAIVTLDTLRKDSFDEYFDWLPGIKFENVWSPGRFTSTAHAAMFCGLYPSELGVNSRSKDLATDRRTIAEILTSHGFRTTAISANPLVSPEFNFDRGFDSFYRAGRTRSSRPEIFDWASEIRKSTRSGLSRDIQLMYKCIRSDSNTAKSLKFGIDLKLNNIYSSIEVQNILKRIDFSENEFLYINIMDAHAPYTPPKEFQTVGYQEPSISERMGGYSSREITAQKEAYTNSIKFLSKQYKKIYNTLARDFDYIFTLSDHGELFGERNNLIRHMLGVPPELVHVPLCISGPELKNRNESPNRSLLEIYPTILNLAGITKESRGKDLLNESSEEHYLTECNGLAEAFRKQLLESNMTEKELSKWDRSRQGVTLSDGGYLFQNYEGKEEATQQAESSNQTISNVINKLNIDYCETSGGKNISEGTIAQLKDLGYR